MLILCSHPIIPVYLQIEYEMVILLLRSDRILRNKKEKLVSLSRFEDTLVVSTYFNFLAFLCATRLLAICLGERHFPLHISKIPLWDSA